MSDGSKPNPPPSDRGAAKPLNVALDDLENMLDQREESALGPHDGDGSNPGSPPPEPPPPESPQAESPRDEAQYPIPLLDDMVMPGELAPPFVSAGDLAIDDPPLGTAALRRRLAERLASEIEVIAQTRIEAALLEVSERIRTEVRDHIEIVLPEIVDELLAGDEEDDG